jgi:hypothetical protein
VFLGHQGVSLDRKREKKKTAKKKSEKKKPVHKKIQFRNDALGGTRVHVSQTDALSLWWM